MTGNDAIASIIRNRPYEPPPVPPGRREPRGPFLNARGRAAVAFLLGLVALVVVLIARAA